MNGFLQILTGNPIGIIRVGPLTTGYATPFDFAAVAEVLGQKAIIRALHDPMRCEACELRQRLQMSHANKAFEIIRREFNVEPDWERYK